MKFIRERPILVTDDLQKKRWGGKPENNGIKLSAEVNAIETPKGFFDVKIKVERVNNEPINKHIAILVHNSFNIPSNTIFIKSGGPSEILLKGYKAFTVGAIINDEENTELELDLNDRSLGYPKEFYH